MSNASDEDIDQYQSYSDLDCAAPTLDENTLICECHCVSVELIRAHFAPENLSIENLKTQFGLGSGCGSCVKSQEDWLKKIF